MKKLKFLFLIFFCANAFGSVGLGLSYGSLGRSLNLGYEFDSLFGARINLTQGTTTVFSNDFYNKKTTGILVDFYPTLTISNFRLSGGFYNVDLSIANLVYSGFAPYLGIGLGRYSDDRLGLYFNADLGLLFSKPSIDPRRANLVDVVVKGVSDTLSAYPVISFGMTLTF